MPDICDFCNGEQPPFDGLPGCPWCDGYGNPDKIHGTFPELCNEGWGIMRDYRVGETINTVYGRGVVIHNMVAPYIYQVSIKIDDASPAHKAQMQMWNAKVSRPAVMPSDIIEEQPA